MKDKLIKCPVCKKRLLTQGIRNHIINSSEGEAHKRMNELFRYNKKNFKNVSRAVLLRQMPHFAYIRRNSKPTNKSQIFL